MSGTADMPKKALAFLAITSFHKSASVIYGKWCELISSCLWLPCEKDNRQARYKASLLIAWRSLPSPMGSLGIPWVKNSLVIDVKEWNVFSAFCDAARDAFWQRIRKQKRQTAKPSKISTKQTEIIKKRLIKCVLETAVPTSLLCKPPLLNAD